MATATLRSASTASTAVRSSGPCRAVVRPSAMHTSSRSPGGSKVDERTYTKVTAFAASFSAPLPLQGAEAPWTPLLSALLPLFEGLSDAPAEDESDIPVEYRRSSERRHTHRTSSHIADRLALQLPGSR